MVFTLEPVYGIVFTKLHMRGYHGGVGPIRGSAAVNVARGRPSLGVGLIRRGPAEQDARPLPEGVREDVFAGDVKGAFAACGYGTGKNRFGPVVSAMG